MLIRLGLGFLVIYASFVAFFALCTLYAERARPGRHLIDPDWAKKYVEANQVSHALDRLNERTMGRPAVDAEACQGYHWARCETCYGVSQLDRATTEATGVLDQ